MYTYERRIRALFALAQNAMLRTSLRKQEQLKAGRKYLKIYEKKQHLNKKLKLMLSTYCFDVAHFVSDILAKGLCIVLAPLAQIWVPANPLVQVVHALAVPGDVDHPALSGGGQKL